MKIDMHCHIRGGSKDALIGLKATIKALKKKGYSGMLITDHNSYQGYLKNRGKPFMQDLVDFSIFVGVEYDTSDVGHVIIILPTNTLYNKLFEKHGMSLEDTSKLVREDGGVLGLAHPYAHGRFGLDWNMGGRKSEELSIEKVMAYIDFIEIFNGTVSRLANVRAKELALKFNKVGVAGSDSHRKSTTGLCSTVFLDGLKDNNDLIKAIKGNRISGLGEGYSLLANSRCYRLMFTLLEFLYYIVCRRDKNKN